MCVKNLNMNAFICKKIDINNNDVSFVGVTDILSGKKNDDGSITIPEFAIVIYVNAIRSNTDNTLPIDYECAMRFTSSSTETTRVAEFKLDEKIEIVDQKEGFVCKQFATNKFVTSFSNYRFPYGSGEYVLKILIRKNPEVEPSPESDIQFMLKFYVTENGNN